MNRDYAGKIVSFLPSRQELEEFAAGSSTGQFLNAFKRMTTWFRLIYDLREDQETSVLIAAAHSKVIEIWVLIPMGLLHSSYSALRTVVDICTSYTFYCSHPIEWMAVCDDRAGWEGRADIVDWHMRYTPACKAMKESFGLSESLNRDYRELSSYVHGIPVAGLPTLKGIQRTVVADVDLQNFIGICERVDYNLNLLFLGVFADYVSSLSAADLKVITGGIDRQKLAGAGIFVPRV